MMVDWIAVDWGTTNLRAFAMQGAAVVAQAMSDEGMGRLDRDGFEPALLRLIAPWLTEGKVTDVVACGMVGSRQGWHEAPYRAVPCAPLDPGSLVAAPTRDGRIRVRLVPGLKQAQPADVMRGEETQIAGTLSLLPGFDGVICLPGTHSKWAHLSAGEVVSFQTFMTGEMFALLSQASVLRHGMQGEGWEDAAFDAGVADALARPERIGAKLFGIRAEGLISGLSVAAARARLSGLLIGMELAAARPYWLGQAVVIVGSEGISGSYARALKTLGVEARLVTGGDAVLAGLAATRAKVNA
ncbi:2-dehydro-3-deoxygalactonokinase [Paragemmobacter ruber]|uniref:2-keto-3-deoxy-galactonokinase n=1 Tax=Paragemmobacter ruber TaxID=1985673 RepID=A0ABW9YAY9_9RHOB|nr:2-dehydro-3-deoxygalactonokinase [Rhodobacter ruber]NBE09206.1 2-keto-3-deoxy-galactonokinase [Rhodobacter ruber]